MSIEKNGVYGDFRAIKKLDSGFGCLCIHCATKKKFSAGRLKREPTCKACEEDHVETTGHTVNLAGDKQAGPLNQLRKKMAATLQLDLDGEGDGVTNVSLFGENAERLMSMLDDDDLETNEVFRVVALKTLFDLIPVAESKYREAGSQSAAYALSNLVNQAREIMAEMEATEDLSDLVNSMIKTQLQPLFLSYAQVLIDSTYRLKRELGGMVEGRKRERLETSVDDMTRELGREVEKIFSSMQTILHEGLV